MHNITFDKEKVSINRATLKREGLVFEVGIDADLAIEYRKGKTVPLREVLKSEKIFSNVMKGELASEQDLKKVFKTDDVLQVADIVIKTGDIQLTAEYRQKLRDEKRKKIIDMIHMNGVDPRTHLPHPVTRVENAMEQARVHIDEFMAVEDQVQKVLDKLRPILPIKFESKKIQIVIPAQYAAKCYSALKNFGNMQKESWQNDGSLFCVIEMPAGLREEFYDKMNKLTHGDMEAKELDR